MALGDAFQKRLDTEWACLMASKETLSISLRQEEKVTYRQALNFGARVSPTILGPTVRVMVGPGESELARYYREQAEAESARFGKTVLAEECLDRDLVRAKADVSSNPEGKLLKGNLLKLEKVRQEIAKRRYNEGQLIIRDALRVERSLPITDQGTDCIEFMPDDDRILRIRVLHPDPAEAKTGADLIYEFHDLDEGTVRVAFIQYKIWEKDTLKLDARMLGQVERLRRHGCAGELCKMPPHQARPPFRFPTCAVFLRPTDRLQNRSAKLVSSGLHVPICIFDDLQRGIETETGRFRRRDTIGKNVNHKIFEDLFYAGFLGSNKMAVATLENLYRETGVLQHNDSVLYHAQEYGIRKSRPKRKRA